ncbi:MAG: hypothetical protein QM695_15950 [Micropruina sp.]
MKTKTRPAATLPITLPQPPRFRPGSTGYGSFDSAEFAAFIERRHSTEHTGSLRICPDDVCDAWWRLVVEGR